MKALNGFAVAATLTLISSATGTALAQGMDRCLFPPRGIHTKWAGYQDSAKLVESNQKLSKCMASKTAAIAFATVDGVFCLDNLQSNTVSIKQLKGFVPEIGHPFDSDAHTPFAVYYNNVAPQGDQPGLMFSKFQTCTPDEVEKLRTNTKMGALCTDFENSSDASGDDKTARRVNAQFIHIGSSVVSKCKNQMTASNSNRNDPNPNGSVRSSGNAKAGKKTSAPKLPHPADIGRIVEDKSQVAH